MEQQFYLEAANLNIFKNYEDAIELIEAAENKAYKILSDKYNCPLNNIIYEPIGELLLNKKELGLKDKNWRIIKANWRINNKLEEGFIMLNACMEDYIISVRIGGEFKNRITHNLILANKNNKNNYNCILDSGINNINDMHDVLVIYNKFYN